MGQIRGKKPHISACNIRSLSSFGAPYAGMHILVSTDNSATEDGQGNFDAYVVGDGVTAATELPLIKTYANDADDEPTAGSDKLVKSGGVAKKIGELSQQFRDLIGNVIADKTVNVTGTNTTDTGAVLKAGEPYLIYVQCATATTHNNCGVWVRNASNSFTQIKRLTAEEYAQGAYIEYTPVEDVSLWVRPYSTGSVKVTVWDENVPATITEIVESSITDAILSESFQYSDIVSENDEVTSASILWPDGATGVMVVTYTNGLPSRVTYSHILDGVTRNFEQVVTYADGDVVSNTINEI